MASAYPGAKQTFTNAAGTQTLSNPDHALYHGTIQDTLGSLQDVVGTTLGTNVLKNFAAGDFPIKSPGGTFNNGVLGTPAITGGTLTSPTINTPAFGQNAVSIVRLNANESTDFQSGGTFTNSTWSDFKGNQNFTVNGTNSTVIIYIRCGMQAICTAAPAAVAVRIVVDSGGTPQNFYLGAGIVEVASKPVSAFSGAQPVVITGLSAGVHTVKTQLYPDSATTTVYCRASTNPNLEFLNTTVVEILG